MTVEITEFLRERLEGSDSGPMTVTVIPLDQLPEDHLVGNAPTVTSERMVCLPLALDTRGG
jgi:hypothetical protein